MHAHDIFDAYERRFAAVMARLPQRQPWEARDRTELVAIARRCLGICDAWIPRLTATTLRSVQRDSFQIDKVAFTSWDRVHGGALLYVPEAAQTGKVPLVILCCGHGQQGKLTRGYQAMAMRLVRQGAMVLVPDNIGQGERTPMGHADSVVPFACGLSVQGLIVMETLGWIEWAKAHPQVDAARIAAIGNSGGGTLTLFLGALSPDVSVIISSGYPSTFEFIARKEKKHCHCNILPGVVGKAEMWQLYGLFAPRRLFIFQGENDGLFPMDLFRSTARKIGTVYEAMGAADRFRFQLMPGTHTWDAGRRLAMSEYLARELGLGPAVVIPDDQSGSLRETDVCLESWPLEARSTDDLARFLTGCNPPDGLRLWDVFPPTADVSALVPVASHADLRQIFAQFECFLCDGQRSVP